MGPRLFLSNLSEHVAAEDLRKLCGAYGAVCAVTILREPLTKASRGLAHVEMATEEAANTCIRNLNGRELHGKMMRVQKSSSEGGVIPAARIGGQACTTSTVFDRRRLALAAAERLFTAHGATV